MESNQDLFATKITCVNSVNICNVKYKYKLKKKSLINSFIGAMYSFILGACAIMSVYFVITTFVK